MKPVSNRSIKEIMSDLKRIEDVVGRDEVIHVLVEMEYDRPAYHIKDYYEGIIKYLQYRQNKKVKDYIKSLYI